MREAIGKRDIVCANHHHDVVDYLSLLARCSTASSLRWTTSFSHLEQKRKRNLRNLVTSQAKRWPHPLSLRTRMSREKRRKPLIAVRKRMKRMRVFSKLRKPKMKVWLRRLRMSLRRLRKRYKLQLRSRKRLTRKRRTTTQAKSKKAKQWFTVKRRSKSRKRKTQSSSMREWLTSD